MDSVRLFFIWIDGHHLAICLVEYIVHWYKIVLASISKKIIHYTLAFITNTQCFQNCKAVRFTDFKLLAICFVWITRVQWILIFFMMDPVTAIWHEDNHQVLDLIPWNLTSVTVMTVNVVDGHLVRLHQPLNCR